MFWKICAASMTIVLWSSAAFAQCEASREVLGILDRVNLRHDTGLSRTDRNARQIALLEEGLAQYPHDYFLLRSRMSMEGSNDFLVGGGQEARLAWIDAMRKKHPGRPAYDVLYANALFGQNTPEAIRLLEGVKGPESAQAQLELVNVFSFGKFRNKERVEKELESFLKQCPAPFSSSALGIIARNGTIDQTARTAAAVRTRLAAEDDPRLRNSWTALWQLEFKARPPAEHDALRKEIAADLARLEKSPERPKLEWRLFLQSGYESLGDAAAAEKIKDEILADFPATESAKEIIQSRWSKQHRYPQNADEAALQAWHRARLTVTEEWLTRWPDDSSLWADKFRALAELPGTTPEDLAATADRFLAAYEKNPNWYSSPPFEFRVAAAFVKHKARLDQVPVLVDRGFQTALKREQQMTGNDRYADDMADRLDGTAFLKLERARVLLDYYAATNQPEKAREIDAELAAIPTTRPEQKSLVLASRAQAAEIQGRKLDALVMYRAAKDARTRPVAAGAKDELSEDIERLWKELGGTPAGMAFLMDKPKATEATDSRWERPKNAMPSFALQDLGGKTWKLVDLKGKAVLANIWATWCGPCRAEHPEFQKLYDKLKDRKDVAVVSINVDDDLGQVAPYMKENSYTFPVLFGREVVDTVVPLLSIPRNWFINPVGKLEWEQIGYGADPKWQETMIAKLEELLPRKN